MEVIRSNHNQQLKLYRSLGMRKFRDELGLLPLEGVRLVSDTLLRGIQPELILLKEGIKKDTFPFLDTLTFATTVITIEEKLFDHTAFTDSPQGILAVVKRPAGLLETVFTMEPALILIIDRLQDPGNLGMMLRSAAAAGAGGVILLSGTVDPATPKALRASMGAYFALPVVEATFSDVLAQLRKRQIQLVETAAEANESYDEFNWKVPVAIVIGNEGSGISEAVKQATDASVAIPMERNVESLNAAAAMSVLFFEAARQRRH